jgi:hypothetical protein
MSGFAVSLKKAENILPQVIPLILCPGIIPLERGNMVAQTIAQQLPEG